MADEDAENMSPKDKLKMFQQQKIMGPKPPDVKISPTTELPAREHTIDEPPPKYGISVPRGGKYLPGFDWSEVEMKMSRDSDSDEEVDKSEMDKGDDFKLHDTEEKADPSDDDGGSEPEADDVLPDTHGKVILKSPDWETSKDEDTDEEDPTGGQHPDDKTSEDQNPDAESSEEEECDDVSYSILESQGSGKGKDDGDGSESESEGEFIDVSREGSV